MVSLLFSITGVYFSRSEQNLVNISEFQSLSASSNVALSSFKDCASRNQMKAKYIQEQQADQLGLLSGAMSRRDTCINLEFESVLPVQSFSQQKERHGAEFFSKEKAKCISLVLNHRRGHISNLNTFSRPTNVLTARYLQLAYGTHLQCLVQFSGRDFGSPLKPSVASAGNIQVQLIPGSRVTIWYQSLTIVASFLS